MSFVLISKVSFPQVAYSSTDAEEDHSEGVSDDEGSGTSDEDESDVMQEEEVCNDGIDNDGDELVDGEDTEDCCY